MTALSGREGAGERDYKGTEGPPGVVDMFISLIVVMDSYICIYTNNYQIMLFKCVYVILCFNKHTSIKLLKNSTCVKNLNSKYKTKEEN